jgi:hypothetical protein
MADERSDKRPEDEEDEREEREPEDERQPWAKTSSGDADSVSDE